MGMEWQRNGKGTGVEREWNGNGHEHEHEDDDDDVLMFEMGELIGYSLTLLGEGEGCCFDAG